MSPRQYPSVSAGALQLAEVRWKKSRTKLCSAEFLRYLVLAHRDAGRSIALANGCWDCLHAGHVRLLQEARAQADILVVAVNSDDGVRRLKGEGRPLWPEAARVMVLSALACVDHVVVFGEDTPAGLIRAVRPDVLVKSEEYRGTDIPGEPYAGRVHLVPLLEGYSTSALVARAQATPAAG